jgi:hypothetical protein
MTTKSPTWCLRRRLAAAAFPNPRSNVPDATNHLGQLEQVYAL